MRLVFWFAALVAGSVMTVSAASLTFATATVGQSSPALVVPELSGQDFDLAKLRGKVVIVNFWATWCSPCREEMPALNSFYQRYRGQGLEMIGLSADHPHDRSDVLKVMQSFSYPAAMLDDAQVNGFGTPSVLPMTFVVDRSGVLRAKLAPGETPLTEKTLDGVVLPLLQQGTATPAPEQK